MFFIDNSDMTIHVTRGDVASISVGADVNGAAYKFKVGDVVRFKVFAKKDCEDVVLKKDTEVTEETEAVRVLLNSEETKIGEVISKPVDYWYEVELNPETSPQTILGYDENGAKVFKLYPEGGAVDD
jgi:protein involved in polysaccharide export with SLBB domain